MTQPAHEHDAKTPAAPQASSPPPAPDTAAAFLADRLPLMTRYVDALCDTGVSHGLMGPREVPRMWERHVLNCAVVHPGIARGRTLPTSVPALGCPASSSPLPAPTSR